jgi:two-component system sensor histidine kinase CpxA
LTALRRVRWPLSRKILGLALLNLILVSIVLVLFAHWQFGLSIEAPVLGPARDRIMSIANAIARDLDLAPYASRSGVLEADSRRYGLDIYLFDPRSQALAGAQVQLPEPVLERMRSRPGGDRRGSGRGDRPGFPPGPGPPKFDVPGGRPSDLAFLTVTRHPLLWWVGVRIPTNGPQGERGVPAVLLLRTGSILDSRLFFDWRSLLWLGAALGAAGLLCWWPFLHGVTRSIRQMGSATEAIAQGYFERHVTLQRWDELGHLGEQINRMAARLEGFVKHQKRFLGDIAHELCTPIARIQFALGILEQKIEQPQQTHLAALREEIQEMSALVNELLMFSKAGVAPGGTPLRCVELAAVVQRAIAHQVLGPGTIEAAIGPELFVAGHEPYLVRAISNLLRNALRHADDDGPVVVGARREGDSRCTVGGRLRIWLARRYA